MNYIDAAIEVLRQTGRPMTDAEIAKQAIASGVLRPTGKTPRQTMSAALYVHAKDPASVVCRVAEQGPVRARRGTVRWTLK
ncbi:MAG: winged helix-turn-helix domain-containing protein [Candidatus Limnocylindrales bacterium]